MYTIEQLFLRACSLMDSLKTDGTVDTSTTSDYRSRTLTLVDIALKKLGIVCDYYKKHEVVRVPVNDPLNPVYYKITLPSDCKTVDKVIFDTTDTYTLDPSYQIERVGNVQYLLIDYNFEGTVRIQYKSVSTQPTSFTDVVEIDDVLAIAICYDLATNYAATEQNEHLTQFFQNEFLTLKKEATKKQVEGNTTIKDYYSDGTSIDNFYN